MAGRSRSRSGCPWRQRRRSREIWVRCTPTTRGPALFEHQLPELDAHLEDARDAVLAITAFPRASARARHPEGGCQDAELTRLVGRWCWSYRNVVDDSLDRSDHHPHNFVSRTWTVMPVRAQIDRLNFAIGNHRSRSADAEIPPLQTPAGRTRPRGKRSPHD